MTFQNMRNSHNHTFDWYLAAYAAIIILLITSCGTVASERKMVGKTLKKRLDLSTISEVIHSDSTVSFSVLRERYKYLSVVYFRDGCSPCYPKFIDWHRRIDSIQKSDDYTVLFVINTTHYDIFRRQLSRYGEVDDKYYYYVDPKNSFLSANRSIPRVLIDRSLLIDRSNHIKMVIEPFANADMTKVFHIVTGVDTQHPGESK